MKMHSKTSKRYPRVTLLVPCFDSMDHIGESIRCALAQTYGHVEIIVAPDDGCTYRHLRDTFKSPQLRIIPPGISPRSGPGATRNRAIDASSGDYFAMLDADDFIPPNYIEELMKVAMVEGAALAPTRYVTWDSRDAVRVPPIHNRLLSLSGFSQLLSSIHPLIHRSFESGYYGGFAEDVIHDGSVIAKLGTISIVDDVAYEIRIRSGSACSSGSEAELKIQSAYAQRIEQMLVRPTEIGLQGLSQHDRNDFADLFRFRAMVSTEFSKSGSGSYNEWLAGNEAEFWDRFTALRHETELRTS